MTVAQGSRRERILSLLGAGDQGAPLVDRVCEVSVAILGASGAGVSLVGGASHQMVTHGTTMFAADLEDLQIRLGEGPGLQAIRTASPSLVPELAQHQTEFWPTFAKQALDRGVHAVFAFPLESGVTTLGALDLYREAPGPLTGLELMDALTLTEIATRGMSRAVDMGVTVRQALAQVWPDRGDDPGGPGPGADRLRLLTAGLTGAEAAPATQTPEGAARQVLVVDDEDGMRLVLGRALGRLGYRVLLAATLDAAIEQLAGNPDLDAVIADTALPVGLDFAGAVIRYHPAVPLLFLTGGPTASGALDDPLIRLVPKPVGIDDLRAQLEELIERADRARTRGTTPVTAAGRGTAGAGAVIGSRDRRIEAGGRLGALPELDQTTATWAAVSGLAGLEPVSAVPGAVESTRLAALGLFAAGVANEVNNMLAVVAMRADLLSATDVGGGGPSAAVTEDANAITAAAARASELVQQLMLFAGQRTLDRGPVDVAALVGDLRARLDEIAGAAGDVACTVQPVPEVLADHEHLERIILNLVRNGLEATAPPPGTASPLGTDGGRSVPASGTPPRRARVQVRVAPTPTGQGTDTGPLHPTPGRAGGRTAAGVVIEVSDCGQGMADDVRARAVEPFFRAFSSPGGSGLGLSTVWGLVSQHGGQLDVDSAPGRGTTVRVTLPAAPQQDHPTPTPTPGKRRTVRPRTRPPVRDHSSGSAPGWSGGSGPGAL